MVQARRTTQVPLNGTASSKEKQTNGSTTSLSMADPKTDYSRWRMLDEDGRQTWHYLNTDEELEKWPQSLADKYYLGLPLVRHARKNHMTCTDELERSRASYCYKAFRVYRQLFVILFETTITLWTLGLRIRRPYVPSAGFRRNLVCHKHTYTEVQVN